MSINKEIWIKDINENTFQKSDFINNSMDFSAYVDNLTVHVPNAGLAPSITKNRSSFPATTIQRTDTDLTFNIDEFSTAPFHLQWSEALEVNYDKRQSLLYNLKEGLRQTIGNRTVYNWSPVTASTNSVTRIVRTMGAPTNSALASGATGSRSAVTLSDILVLKNILDNDFVPDNDRFLIVPSSIWNTQILPLTQLTNVQTYGSSEGLKTGLLGTGTVEGSSGMIYGFNVMVRPTTAVYLTGATPVQQTIGDDGSVTACNVTDNLSILAYQKASVCIAKGETEIFYSEARPEYYGDLFSSLVRMGGTIVRKDVKGIAALVQQ